MAIICIGNAIIEEGRVLGLENLYQTLLMALKKHRTDYTILTPILYPEWDMQN